MFLFNRKKSDKEKKKEKIKNKNKLSLYKLPENFWMMGRKKITTKMNLSSKDNKVYFGAIGGVGDRIGANLYLYGTKGDWIIVDMGMGFPTHKMSGAEYVVPDTLFLSSIKDKIKGILLTHSHEDHYGAIPFIWKEVGCPVYGTPFAIKMVLKKAAEFNLEKKIPVKIIDPMGAKLKIGAFEIEYIHLTHSILEACGIVIKTEQGNIFHTGDWKFDKTPMIGKPYNMTALKKLANDGVLAIVGESTNSILDEHTASEKDVFIALKKEISQIKSGKIVLTCFATNVMRMNSVYNIAKHFNRKLVILGRSMESIVEIATETNYLQDFEYISSESAKKFDDDKLLYLCTGTQGEPRSALTRIANDEYRDLKLHSGDTVIYSSKMIPGNEEEILAVQNKLSLKGVNIIATFDNKDIHASGHAGIPEIKDMYNLLKPQILIPVHGEPLHLIRNAKIGKECKIKNIKTIQNGEFITIEKEKAPKTIEVIPIDDIIIDGTRKINASNEIFANRRKINYNGNIFITLSVKKNSLIKVAISSLGVFESNNNNDLNKMLVDEIERKFKNIEKSKLKSDKDIISAITSDMKRIMFHIMGKKPPVIIHIVRI